MATNYGPRVTGENLLLALDPANSRCFNSGDTSCVNLITGGLVTGANGQPGSGAHTPNTANFPAYNSVNGGVFDFAGGRGMNVEEDLGQHTQLTIEMWYYKNSSGTQYFTDGRNNGGQWFLSNYQSQNITFTNAATYNFDTSYLGGNSDFVNRWQHMVFTTGDRVGSTLYIDGIPRTLILNNNTDKGLGRNYRIGTRYTVSEQWTGYMGPIRIYNKVFTAAEARQNFVAHKGRFGL